MMARPVHWLAAGLLAAGIAACRDEPAPARTDSAREALERARSLVRSGEIDRAFVELGKALAIDPDDPVARRELGDLYVRREQYYAAEAEYVAALARRDDAPIRRALGWVAYLRERDDEALRHYTRAIELEDPAAPDALTHQMLGLTLMRLERHEHALEAFLRVVEMRPEDAQAVHNVGCAYRMIGRHELAIETLSRALALSPGEPRSLYELAMAQSEGGYRRAAITTLQSLLATMPQHRQARELLKKLVL